MEGDRYWHSISHLQPETSYDIKMQCFNEGGESEFSNVMICETKARKSSGQPGRLPPPTLAPPQPPPPETIERPVGPGAIVVRSSDLPYLIVGVVLGSIVLIIVAFIPFCLWRAWSKQKHTTDLGFPRSALLSPSCQYTMVPLGGLPGHRASGHPYLSGTSGRACANGLHVNRACPAATVGYPGMKPQQHCPGELQQQQDDTSNVLRQTVLGSGYDPHRHQIPRAPKSNPEEGSFLYTLPDDSTHQLPQPSQDCHHLQEQSAATGQRGMNNGPRSPGLEAVWDPLFHPGPPCCLGLAPVEEVDSPDSCQAGRGAWCPQHPPGAYRGQELGTQLCPSPPVHVSFETPPPTI